jgi:hypothetical protein
VSYTTVIAAKAMRVLERLSRKTEKRVQSRLDGLLTLFRERSMDLEEWVILLYIVAAISYTVWKVW